MGAHLVAIMAATGLMLPGAAAAQHYEYLATGTISKVQAVDENGADVAGYDYSKYTAAGIVVSGSASYSTTIDSDEPDVTNPPDVTQGTYENAFPSLTIGSVTMSGMKLNNAIAVLDNRAGGQDTIPFAHDVFGYGGSMPKTVYGASWIRMNNGTPAERKGSAVVLIQAPSTTALTGNGLPTSLTLADFNLLKTIAVDTLDIETGQRVTVEATVTALAVDTNAVDPAPGLPVLGSWGAALLVAALVALGGSLTAQSRRNEA
jgi:hypothetical protein